MTQRPPIVRRRRRSPWLARLVALSLLVALGVVGFAAWTSRDQSDGDAIAAPPSSPTVAVAGATTLPATMIRTLPAAAGGSTPHQEGDLWLATPDDAERTVTEGGQVVYLSPRYDTAVLIWTSWESVSDNREQAARDMAANLAFQLGGNSGPVVPVGSIGQAYVVHITNGDLFTDARYVFVGATAVEVVGAASADPATPSPADVTWLSLTIGGEPAITP